MWYPVTSFTKPSHITNHKSLQSTLLSSMNVANHIPKLCSASAMKLDKKSVLLYLSILLIAHSHDTEINPGPYTPKYPCGVCLKAVKWSRTRKAVACDTCDTWYHIDCMGMSSDTYDKLNRSDVSWICTNCNTPNYSSSLLDSYLSFDSENSFQVLSNINSTYVIIPQLLIVANHLCLNMSHLALVTHQLTRTLVHRFNNPPLSKNLPRGKTSPGP